MEKVCGSTIWRTCPSDVRLFAATDLAQITAIFRDDAVQHVFMGAGIASMHYIGMEAMRLPAMCSYSWGLVWLSAALAIARRFLETHEKSN